MDQIIKILKEPLLHFLIAGVLLYFGYHALNNYVNRDDNVIVLNKGEIEMLEEGWQMRWNRPPSPEEKEGLIRQNIRDKILYRTALEMGLDQQDMVIQRRMVQKIEYLGAEIMQPPQPSETQLVQYYEENKSEYLMPELISMSHIFFNPDKRDLATLDDAATALARLNRQADPTTNLSAYGDTFMLASYYPNKTELEIRKFFGSGFTESVFALEPGKWHGPVLSGYGTHLVFVHNLDKNEVPEYTEVRDLVLEHWMAQEKSKMEDLYIEGLMDRYEIVIEN